jgi:hypothetical protein
VLCERRDAHGDVSDCAIVLDVHWNELIEPEREEWIDLRLPDNPRRRRA